MGKLNEVWKARGGMFKLKTRPTQQNKTFAGMVSNRITTTWRRFKENFFRIVLRRALKDEESELLANIDKSHHAEVHLNSDDEINTYFRVLNDNIESAKLVVK